MFTVNASFLNPCKRCISRLNVSKHGLTSSRTNLSVSLSSVSRTQYTSHELTAWSLSKRYHSTERASKTHHNTDNETVQSQDSKNGRVVFGGNDTGSDRETWFDSRIAKSDNTSSRQRAQRIKPHVVDNGWQKPEGFHTGINIFNTLTRQKEPLILPNGRIVSW